MLYFILGVKSPAKRIIEIIDLHIVKTYIIRELENDTVLGNYKESRGIMKKKLIALNTTIMLGLGSVFSIPAVQAESSVQSQRTEVQSQISKAQELIKSLQAQQTKLENQIALNKKAIKTNNTKIKNTQAKIKKTNTKIKALKKDIVALEERIAQRQEVLKDRAVAFQESGGDVDYIGVLLGSSDFSDFISRVGAIATIVEADQGILKEQENDKAELEDKKAAVQENLDSLKDSEADLKSTQADLKEQKKQIETTMASLEKKEKQTADLKTSLEQKDAELGAKIAAITEANNKATKQQVAQQDTLNKAASKVQSSTSSSQSKSTSTSTAAPSSVNVSVAISAGYKYIGNSTYVWGGGRTASDVAKGYFDCSGFVSWAYRQAGVSLPATTSALRYAGKQVSTSQMQPGDLVFFNTYKTDGHVGIYIGGGKFIGAQSSTGVAIASMNSGYWGSVFNGRVVRVN